MHRDNSNFQEQTPAPKLWPKPEILFWTSVGAMFKHCSKWYPERKKWF